MKTHVMTLNGMAGNRLEPEAPAAETSAADALAEEIVIDDVYQGRPGVGIGSYGSLLAKEDDPELPAGEAIARLFERMRPYRRALAAIIDFCRVERSSAEVDEMLAPIMANRRSAYTPIAMRDMLSRAQALDYLVPELDEPAPTVDEEGNLLVVDEPEGTWLSSQAALLYLDEQDAAGEIGAAVFAEPAVAPVFMKVLAFCAEEGRTPSQISALVDDDLLLQEPRRSFDYFLDKLETAGGLEWLGSWQTTAEGLAFLQTEGEVQ